MKKYIPIIILCIFTICISGLSGWMTYTSTKESLEASVYSISGKVTDKAKVGEPVKVEWTTDRMPNCDALVINYIINNNSKAVLFQSVNAHTAWGHTNYINGPDDTYIGKDGKIRFPVYHQPLIGHVGPGEYTWRMEFQFYCNAFDRLFPTTNSVEPFVFEVVE